MSKPVGVATICHNDDDARDPLHRRVRIELHRDGEGYRWKNADGTDFGIGVERSVGDAEYAAIKTWQAPHWDLLARWVLR